MKYLEGLNEPQQRAVLHTEGPLMVIAGAGSGKTRVLTNRIAHLIHHGVDAFNILALTFTNKAANEMRQRIEKMVGNEARNLWIGTFHSVFAKILRFEAEKVGYTSNFSIYDTDDSKNLLKTIIKEQNLDDKIYKPSIVLHRISNAKNNLVSWQEYISNPQYYEDDKAFKRPELGKLYQIYQERLLQANAMDFDDLLFNTNLLFKQHLDVLHKYQHKFKYILIDEFQDTNYAQYLIIRRLSAVHQNICVVGDDAQSIYAFRGADIGNILNFEKDYPDLTVIRLEQNYRSTNNIVQAANSVIAKNIAQIPKKVWTKNEAGNLIRLLKATSDNEEGRLVANAIYEDKVQYGYKNSDFAILYRTNAQSRAFEEALRKINIKYRIVGGLSFYQRKEIKDLIAYFRYAVNQKDEEAFKRIINLPKRGIGDTTVAKLVVAAYENKTTIWNILENPRQVFSGKTATALEDFRDLIKSFTILIKEQDAYTAAKEIAKQSGILKELYEDKTIEGLSRYENVQELLNAIKEFTDNPENTDKSLSAFLQQVSLLTLVDEPANDQDNDKVTLMTIHAAKGLEFKHVFVVGLEENLFPSPLMTETRADLEEERRLFYVAITRAQKKLTLSYALTRYFYGKLNTCEPSRFLDEIDKKYIEDANPYQRIENYTNTNLVNTLRGQTQNTTRIAKSNLQHVPQYTPSTDFRPSDTKNLRIGMQVEHMKFGYGKVTAIEMENNQPHKATIQFDTVGEKTLLLSFAKLRIV
ncbi:MAG: UvrD-helicase domain-containing protein [Microscillaceae bacterium]|nr:UvrD-helicase domain-containing protein [Microscillaceae bacterium]MDW8460503.1 UvrD-helicase domain-containing protein [Cytophagales bacterium]